jgi:hypothetical protein
LEISQNIVVKRKTAVGNITPQKLQDKKEIHPRPEQKQARKGPDR